MATQLPLIVYEQPPHPQPSRRRVCDLPAAERPLYRLHHHGREALAGSELLALVLGTAAGPGLAQDLLDRFGSLHGLARATKAQLMAVRGIGEAQAGRLTAVLELCRRLQAPPEDQLSRVTSPDDAAALLIPRLRCLNQEELWVLLLNTRNQVLGMEAIYKGSLNTSMVRLSEVFRPAIEAPAAAVIVAHNHPSGDPSPSPEDVNVTRQMAQAGDLLDITLLDHLIIGDGVHISLKERGLGFD